MAETKAGPKRQRALDAAQRVFSQHGYTAGSINDVAQAAGMSRHNLLYYFPSKRDLLIGVLEGRDAALDPRLKWLESASTRPLTAFLESLDKVLPEIYGDRELVQLYHRLTSEASDHSHPGHAWVLARYARVHVAAQQLFAAAIASGEVTAAVDPEGLGVALLGAIEGIESQWLVDATLDWQRAVRALRELVMLAMRSADVPSK